MHPPRADLIRLGVFELDLGARELRREGRLVRLQDKPYELLMALVERPGEVVTRDELRQRLWPADTFVDFDQSLNTAAAKVREALGDSAESPVYVVTVPRRGYRLIAPVARVIHQPIDVGVGPVPPGVEQHPQPLPALAPGKRPRRSVWHSRRLAGVILAATVLLAGGYIAVRWPRTEEATRRAMLAVLPLEPIGGQGENEALADGLTEEITTAVARLNPALLGVIARTSVARYQTQPKSIREIGRELNVDYVLEGSVRRAEGRIRITAQLIDVDTESHVWAQVYDRGVPDIFTIEADIAASVARQLAMELLPETSARRPPDPDAHVAYLQGLHFWNKRDEENLRRAIDHFRQAIDQDPTYARAYAGLASAYASMATSADALPATEARTLAHAVARRALEIDPNLPEGHAVTAGIACRFDWDWRTCEQGLRRALELNTNYATARHLLGELLLQRGRFEEAIAQFIEARKLDPLSAAIHTHLGLAYMYGRRYGEALACYAQALDIDSKYLLAQRVKGLTLVRSGRIEDGLAVLRQARVAEPESGRAAADLGYALGLAQRAGDARQIMAELDLLASRRHVSAYDFAVVHAGLGDGRAALDWLEKAFAQRATGLRWLKIEPIFDGLRYEPRFQTLLRRVGIAD